MLNVEIYENSNKIADIHIQKQFMILEANGKVFWEADGKSSKSRDRGEIHVWIRKEASQKYKIVSVRKDWSMSIDKQSYPSQVHLDVEIDNHVTRLRYRQYQFVCSTI